MSAFSPMTAFADTIPVVIPPTPVVIEQSIQIDEVACNCYLYVKNRIKALPLMKEVIPNTTPHKGAVAIFNYKDKTTGLPVKHIAIMGDFDGEGFWVRESNFTNCEYGKRYILFSDSHLVGFWSADHAL